jgi:hypothetical protein
VQIHPTSVWNCILFAPGPALPHSSEHELRRSTTEVAGLGVGNGVLRFVKQRLQGFMTVPLPDTSAYLGLCECLLPGARFNTAVQQVMHTCCLTCT